MKKIVAVALLAASTMTSIAPVIGFAGSANGIMSPQRTSELADEWMHNHNIKDKIQPSIGAEEILQHFQQVQLASNVNYPTIIDSILRNQRKIDQTIDTVWNEFARGVVSEKIKQQLEGRKLGNKKKIYNTEVSLANFTQKKVSRIPGTNQVKVRLVLPGNNVNFKSTTGTIFGSWADPSFRVFYDLTFNLTISVNKSGNPINVDQLTVEVSNSRYRGSNVSGTLVKAVGDFITRGGFSNSVRSQFNQQIELREQLGNAIASTIKRFQ